MWQHVRKGRYGMVTFGPSILDDALDVWLTGVPHTCHDNVTMSNRQKNSCICMISKLGIKLFIPHYIVDPQYHDIMTKGLEC